MVARAKLEAKKKYGTHAQQEMERKTFVDKRVRDDYGRLLGRQTAQFADAVAQLAPFRVGHSDEFVTSSLPRFDYHHPYVQAGKLLLDILPALAEPQVSERSQRAADALLSALEHGNPDEGSFFSFVEVLSDDETIQRGIDKVLGQLLNARPEDRRASRSQASPGGGQLAPSGFRASPDSAGLALKRLTCKEPATLKDNNFAPANTCGPPPEVRNDEQPRLPSIPSDGPQNLSPAPNHTGFMPDSPSLAYFTPSTTMPPPSPAQARSSGRERKPTAKMLAGVAETPSRQSAGPPSLASRPSSTRNSRSAPRVPSKLALSEFSADQEETPATSAAPAASQHPQTLPEGTRPITTTADQRTFPPIINGPLFPPVIPRSLQQHPNILAKVDLPPVLDPQLTANLLQLAEIAANMSDSDDDDLEMESNDLPHHERLIRALEAQPSTTRWHINTPVSTGKVENSAPEAPLPSPRHSQITSVDPAPAQPTSLPPVNTIMSTKEARAASSFFKSLVAGEPPTNVQRHGSANSKAMKSYSGADQSFVPTQNLHAGNTMTNGDTSSVMLSAAGQSGLLPQLQRQEAQNVNAVGKTLSGKIQLSDLDTNGQGTVPPQLSRPEVQAALTRQTTMSPQRSLLPLDRKRKLEERKIEDEGYDIAMSRLRSYAKSLSLTVDSALSYEQLNTMIDNHDKSARYAHSGANGPSTAPVSTGPYSHGPPMNGAANHGSAGPGATVERPSSSEGLRRLVPSSTSPVYNHLPSPFDLPPPGSLAAQYFPSPNNVSYSDAQRFPTGYVNNTYSKTFQFVTPKQPEQFSNQNSPLVDKPPSLTNGEDTRRQQHQDALNGGPPGGGVVINSRSNKKPQSSNTANFKFLVNAKDTPIAQSQPKRGGQLMTFS